MRPAGCCSRPAGVYNRRSAGRHGKEPRMKYVAIFHANLNYAYLTPSFYERTIRASYETIIDRTKP